MLRKLASLSRGLAYWSGIAGAAARQASGARVLCYHGIVEGRAAELARQLSYLKRHFEIVPLAVLVARLDDGGALKRCVAVTFDDGLRNNVTIAYPILRRLGVPATFFVCPGLIDADRWLWNHEARQRLSRCSPALRAELAGRSAGALGEVEPIIDWLKKLPLTERQAFEECLRRATPGFRPTPQERHAFDVANWEELRRLDAAVVSVDSHTVSHAILPTLTADDCNRELAESRRMIEQRLQRPAQFFAYPNGDSSPAVREAARRHYRAAVLATPGLAAAGSDRLALPRVVSPAGALRFATSVHRAASVVLGAASPPNPLCRPRPGEGFA